MKIIEETIINQAQYHSFIPEVTCEKRNSEIGTIIFLGVVIVGSAILFNYYLKMKEEEKKRVSIHLKYNKSD